MSFVEEQSKDLWLQEVNQFLILQKLKYNRYVKKTQVVKKDNAKQNRALVCKQYTDGPTICCFVFCRLKKVLHIENLQISVKYSLN